MKSSIKQELAKILESNARFSITLDEYTSNCNRRYMNVNLHLKLQVWILGLARIFNTMPAESAKGILEDDLHFLAKKFSLFEATGSKSSNLQLLEQSLYTIPPTSVEAERAFSAAGLFNSKLRPSLSDSSLDALVFLKGHFKNTTK